jgi:hypothetical protein
MIYVAALILVVVCIPLMHDAKHLRSSQTWPAGIARSGNSFLG